MANIIIIIVSVFDCVLLCILIIATNRLFKRFDEMKADLNEWRACLTEGINEWRACLTGGINEVNTDVKTTEARLTESINEVKADLTGSINEVKADVKAVADRLQRHEDKCAARDIQMARLFGNLETAVTGRISRDISLDKEEI